MNRDLWSIAHAVEDPAERIGAFRREYTEETPDEVWAEAGIPASAPREYIAKEMVRLLSELAGFRWTVNAALGCIQPFGDGARDATEGAGADTPGGVAAE